MVALKRVWADQKAELIEFGTLEEFEKRLRREWSIETGIIENVYTLDRGVTKTLIEKGIEAALIPHGASNKDPERVARIIQDHYDALEGMFDFVGRQRELTAGYIKELHAALLRNQDTYTVVDQFGNSFEKPLEKGRYKDTSNSPTRPDGSVHEYCPPEHVASEMDRLLQMHVEHEAAGVPVEVEAAWLHHRFAQIHPFADGNGRVARAIASLIFIKAYWFPLIVKRDDWDRYIENLEKADSGDLRPLVAMFVEAQRTALIQATEAAYEVEPIASVEQAITAARDRLIHRGSLPAREGDMAKRTASRLAQHALQRFEQVAIELRTEIGSLGPPFRFAAHHNVAVSAARADAVRDAGQAANFAEYSDQVQLGLHSVGSTLLGISFQALGSNFRGIVGVVAYVDRDAVPSVIDGGTFQINYAEDFDSAQKRFSAWLERVIVEGLNEWRKTL
ncbi:MAG: Fic family protein [Bryobacteraceae bacterium]